MTDKHQSMQKVLKIAYGSSEVSTQEVDELIKTIYMAGKKDGYKLGYSEGFAHSNMGIYFSPRNFE